MLTWLQILLLDIHECVIAILRRVCWIYLSKSRANSALPDSQCVVSFAPDQYRAIRHIVELC